MRPEELRAARLSLGLTQAQMGAALKSDARTVRRWENGERAIPGPAQVAVDLMLKIRAETNS